MAASASPKTIGVGFATYSSTSRPGGFKFGSSKGGSEFKTFTKINIEHVSGEWLVIPPSHLREIQAKILL